MSDIAVWLLGLVLISSSLGVILAKKPVHACLSFLLTLLALALTYLQLSAQFIAVMQILVYAGAILVIFMFVIVLFQDAHAQIARYESQSQPVLLYLAAGTFILALIFLGSQLVHFAAPSEEVLPQDFGTVQGLGRALYLQYFFPFEAVTLLFLIAVVGALYTAKKEKA